MSRTGGFSTALPASTRRAFNSLLKRWRGFRTLEDGSNTITGDLAVSGDAAVAGGTLLLGDPGIYVTGNPYWVETAADSSFQLTGDQSVVMRVRLDDWGQGAAYLWTRYDKVAPQGGINFFIDGGSLRSSVNDGTATSNNFNGDATFAVPSEGRPAWFGFTLDASDGSGDMAVTFWEGGDGDTPSWSQLGTTQTWGGSDNTVLDNGGKLYLMHSGGSLNAVGAVYEAHYYDGIGANSAPGQGTLVASFVPTLWSDESKDSLGNTWTPIGTEDTNWWREGSDGSISDGQSSFRGDVKVDGTLSVESTLEVLATDGPADLVLDAGGTTGNMDPRIRFLDDGVARWIMRMDESSDVLHIRRNNSSGSYQDTPLEISGSTGIVDVNGVLRFGSNYISSWATTTINDDAVAYCEMFGSGGNGVIIVSGNLASSAGAMMGHFRFDNGLAIMSRSVMYFQDATSGYTAETATAPTGTTYTDGRINLVQYDSGATNRFYIENRSAAGRAWTVTVISTNTYIESVSQGNIT